MAEASQSDELSIPVCTQPALCQIYNRERISCIAASVSSNHEHCSYSVLYDLLDPSSTASSLHTEQRLSATDNYHKHLRQDVE